ncbi:MAG: RagB/SusD family nutrient uptake outer membrane protein [Odoribacteraceae bacterium]|jgi:hypothetical protein|nr:RagB/SusD family nutrient uptake outer membrane protein [Odoribacteraceae bacterium]
MKKIYHILLALLALSSGCGEFTDLDPKGKNLLGSVTDLDQLLNYQFSGNDNVLEMIDVSVLVDDQYPIANHVPNLISAPVKTLRSIWLTWDEQGDRAALTRSDTKYERCYEIIGQVANPVLLMADAATGDRDMANRLKAEAYVLRAYFHYLVVNVYAKAYHPATAATDGGVPYVKEHDLLTVPRQKYTVQKVYDFILEDLQAAYDLESLPDHPTNAMRVGKAFAYAVEAKVRMSMRDFTGAEAAANRSLAIQNALEDHRDNLIVGEDDYGDPVDVFDRPELRAPEDLFYASTTYVLFNAFTPGLSAAFEEGSIMYNTISKLNIYSDYLYGLEGIDVILADNVYFNAAGLTTVDMYLTLAECKIRSGDVPGAMSILNDTIRAKRIDPYTPLAAANAPEAFAILKRVSRTETWFGPKHFINLKRWNTEEAYKETLRKTLLGVDYELRPDSPLWIFPFPQNATGYNPNLTQNYE